MDFALILFIALIVTGAIVLWDRLARNPEGTTVDGSERKDPWLVEYSKAFFPVILVVGLILATWLMARAVVTATQEYGDRLASELEGIEQAVDEANDGIEAIAGFVAATAGAADSLVSRVADLPSELTVPLPSVEIPDFELPIIDYTVDLPEFSLGDGDLSIPIPGVEPLKDLADDIAARLRELRKIDPHATNEQLVERRRSADDVRTPGRTA